MMKAIAATLLIFASVLAIQFADGASSPARPAGVDERDWIPVSDKMGFVVTTPHYYPGLGGGDQPLLLTPPTEGYFTIRNRNGWHRIIIQDPSRNRVRQADYRRMAPHAQEAQERYNLAVSLRPGTETRHFRW
jgi:hypothetical protein